MAMFLADFIYDLKRSHPVKENVIYPVPAFYLWLSRVSSNERRYICKVFRHWLAHCSVIHRKGHWIIQEGPHKWNLSWFDNIPQQRSCLDVKSATQIRYDLEGQRAMALCSSLPNDANVLNTRLHMACIEYTAESLQHQIDDIFYVFLEK